MGTALYFAEYDVMRHWLGRKRDGTSSREGDGMVQGDVPDWAKGWLPKGIIPFLCGSFAGVTSWALIYPVDVSSISFVLYQAIQLTTGYKGKMARPSAWQVAQR
jgi:hypothetical protein